MAKKKKKATPDDGDLNIQKSEAAEEPLNESGSLAWFKVAALSLGLLWLSFPPIGLWWLGWVAVVPLVWLAVQPLATVQLTSQRKRFLRGRFYRQLYVVGLLYWLGTFYFIPIPHPALWIGWIVVSAYMAVYTPIFVGVSRTMIHKLRIPALIAVPIAWTGVEWIRSHFATGMALVCLSHTQYKHPIMIQVADLCGGYTLTFMMALFATGIALATSVVGSRLIEPHSGESSGGKDFPRPKFSILPVLVSVAALALVLVYGNYRLNESIETKNDSVARIALIQTSHDVIFRPPTEDETKEQFDNKDRLTKQARSLWKELDLVVWPESAFNPYFDLLSDIDAENTEEYFSNMRTQIWSGVTGYPEFFDTPVSLLTGAGTYDPKTKSDFASAILINKQGAVTQRYFKNHLVMVGEYVPLIDFFPFMKGLMVIPSTTAGTEFEAMDFNGVIVSPNICFESTVPHFIRRQVNSLADAGTEPDVMINMTNDGWFFGTSCLDLHLACNVFRAVEMRKPHLVCANTGFSAEIDSCGRLVQLGPRRAEGVLMAEVKSLDRTSLYRSIGDVVPGVFGWLVVAFAVYGWWNRKKLS